MLYVPDEWIINKENKNKIFGILEKLDVDIIDEDSYTEDEAIKELKDLGETTIIEKLQKGLFSFGA